MDSLNILLLSSIIPKGFSCHLDATTNGRVRNNPAFPDGLNHFIPGNQTPSITNKKHQQLDHLWLSMNRLTIFGYLETICIKRKLIENITHFKGSEIR